MNEGYVVVFFYPSSGRLTACAYGSDKNVEAVEIRKGADGLPVMKLTEASGKTTQYGRAGANELSVPTAEERTAAAQRDIQRYFAAEESSCDD